MIEPAMPEAIRLKKRLLKYLIFPILMVFYGAPSHATPDCGRSILPSVARTRRLVLKRTTSDDEPVVFNILQMPAVIEMQGEATPLAFANRNNSAAKSRDEYTVWQNGKIVGSVQISVVQNGWMGLNFFRPGEIWISFGYMLTPEVWGHGLGTEVAEAAIRLAEKTYHPTGFFARTLKANQASHKILLKLGFRSLGEGGDEILFFRAKKPLRVVTRFAISNLHMMMTLQR